jgi:hypothetical protein
MSENLLRWIGNKYAAFRGEPHVYSFPSFDERALMCIFLAERKVKYRLFQRNLYYSIEIIP